MAFPQRGRTAPGLGVALIIALAAATALLRVSPALAISNGVPDGNGHPNVGLLAVEEGGVRAGACSGSYAGARKGFPGAGVFLTAGHCVAGLPEDAQLWVTFDSAVTIDPDTFEVTAANWYRATGFAFDPAFGQSRPNPRDYAVVLLETTVGVAPVELPEAGLLDELAAQGGLRRGTVFENVGYGLIPSFKQGPPTYELPTARMFSTSLFQGLTRSLLKLLMNSDVGEENGGICFGDSGSPKLIPHTNTIVALASGGDAICRALNNNQRLDVADARAFLGRYLQLP
jgi:hypothetical protein